MCIRVTVSASGLPDSTALHPDAMKMPFKSHQRLQQERILRETAVKYHTLFEATSDGILLLRDGVFVDCNSRVLEMFGCTRAQLLGKALGDFSPTVQPDSQPSAQIIQARIATALASGEPQSFEWQHQRSDGGLFTAEITLNGLKLDNESYLQVIVRDISERKKTEQMLRQYSRALEQSANTVVITNTHGIIEYVNPKFVETTGYSYEEAIGANPRILKSGDVAPEEYEQLWQTIARGGEWHGQLCNRRKDGTLYWESASVAPIRDEQGIITHFVAIMEDITQRKVAEQALYESQLRYRQVFAAVGDALFLFDRRDGRILDANQAACKLYDYSREELLAMRDTDLAAPSMETSMTLPRLRSKRNVERRHRRKGGVLFPVSVSVRHFSHQGRDIAVAVVRDITDQKLAEHKIIRLSRFYAALSKTGAAIIRCTEPQDLFQQVCQIVIELEQMVLVWIGSVTLETGRLVPMAHASLNPYVTNLYISTNTNRPEGYGPTSKALCSGQPAISNDFLADPDNQPWYEIAQQLGFQAGAAFPLRRGGKVVASLSAYAAERDFFDADISELLTVMAGELSFALDMFDREAQRKAAEERIRHLAAHDPLTGLPNRALLLDRLTHALHSAQRKNHCVGVLFIDLDHFKTINDSLGHASGDQLLRAVAQRLRSCVRAEDTLARQGGDEFILVLQDINGPDAAGQVARHLLQALTTPFVIDDHSLYINASIGISIYPVDTTDADTLIRFADGAMYKAKDAGRASYAFFTAELNARASEQFALGNQLRQGLERGELVLHYQPQFALATGQLIGMETLVRWHHPEQGLVLPKRFIPVAEETGLINLLGEWILHTACTQMRRWRDAGLPSLLMAVNLSAKQWLQPDLEEQVLRVLEVTGLPPRYLELEITEGVLMRDMEKMSRTMWRLHDHGVLFAIDDFGMGYSNLSYLKRFPLNRLKIDLSFVRDITTDPDDAAIVSAIIQIGKSLYLNVIAEGVETAEQLAFLRHQGCDEVQGYYLSKPLPAEDLTAQFQAGQLAPGSFG
ncbi:MAG: EAL domain-containing protein [Candidatus Competibacteraceae bacterium]